MNTILVINGSPKGKNSITLHTCLFLEKKFPGYQYGQNLFLTPVVFSLERWRLFLIRLLAVVGWPPQENIKRQMQVIAKVLNSFIS